MAQFNQLITSASDVVLPPDGHVALFFTPNRQVSFLDSAGVYLTGALVTGDAVTASVATSASLAQSSLSTLTASSADSFLVRNNLTVQGVLSASIFYADSSSVVFTSGSNALGNSLSNVQELTGSVGVTGSFVLDGFTQAYIPNLSGSLYGSASYALNSLSSSFATTASYALNGGSGGGGTTVIVSASQPPESSSISGTLWYDTTRTNLYVQVQSPTGSTWAPAIFALEDGNVSLIVEQTIGIDLTSPTHGTKVTGSLSVISGSVSIQTGSFTLTSGSATIKSGSLIVDTGSVSIVLGGLSLLTGSLIINSGSTTINSGSLTITSGSITINTGSVTVMSGSLGITSGSVSINTGSLFVTSGSVTVRSGSLTIISGTLNMLQEGSGSNMIGTASWAMYAVNAGATTIITGSTPSTASVSGTLWFDTVSNNLYVQTSSPTASIFTASTWLPVATKMVTGSVTASVDQTKGFLVNSAASGSIFSGSIQIISGTISMKDSGSAVNIFGTASAAVSASWAGYAASAAATPIIVSASSPGTSSVSGTLWWNSNDGNLYVQAVGPTGSGWVPATTTVANNLYGATVKVDQLIAANTWSITHNLGTTAPIVQVYSGSTQITPTKIVVINSSSIQILNNTAALGTTVISTGIGGPTTSSYYFATYATSSQTADTASYYAGTVTTASFAITASYVINNAWSAQVATSIGAVTTAPTKPTTRLVDYHRYRYTTPKSALVEFKIGYTATAGLADGSGQYLFSLPSGLTWNNAVYPFDTSNNTTTNSNNATQTNMIYSIPAQGAFVSSLIDSSTDCRILPYNSTTYRVIYSWGTGENTIISSGVANFTGTTMYSWMFEVSIP